MAKKKKMRPTTINLGEAVKKWKAGEIVWSAELGGLGPSYEQAIQVLLWEICSEWEGPMLKAAGGKYPEGYSEFVDKIVSKFDKEWRFSGAQVGAAKQTAFQFLLYGYAQMMNKLPEARHIQVSNGLVPKPTA